jgi:DNA-binding transcriptional ArsR family regulator
MLKQAAEVFKALAEESRARILEILREGPLPVTEIAKRLGLTQPTISHHLSILKMLRCVRDEKRGKQVFYFLDEERVLSAIREYADRFGLHLGKK